MNDFSTLKNNVAESKLVIEKSVFIAYAKGVLSVEEARDFVSEVSKKNYDATHNCYAYVFDDKAKFSDDGEPGGTAGMPILDAIKKSNLNRVCVVVTRYFGGVKLGAGGLVRAYSSACASAISAAVRVLYKLCKTLSARLSYTDFNNAASVLKSTFTLDKTAFADDVCVEFSVPVDKVKSALSFLSECFCGRAQVEVSEAKYLAFEV